MSEERFPNLRLAVNAAFVAALGASAYPSAIPAISDAFTRFAYGATASLSTAVTAFGIYGIACAIKGTETKNEPKL